MEVFIAIVSLVCSILSIILFFKVWGMCNDVEKIAKCLSKQYPSPELTAKQNEDDKSWISLLVAIIGAITLVVILCASLG